MFRNLIVAATAFTLALIGSAGVASATFCGDTFQYDKTSDFTDSKVVINFRDSDTRVEVTAASGYRLVSVQYDNDNDPQMDGTVSVGTGFTTIIVDPAGSGDVDSVRVIVEKFCAPTATPTSTPTVTPTVPGPVCDNGQHVGNPHCTPTPTPSPTATPTASPTATPTASPTPSPTVIPTPEPTVAPTPAPEVPSGEVTEPCADVKGVGTHSVVRPADWYSLPIALRDPDCGQFIPDATPTPTVVLAEPVATVEPEPILGTFVGTMGPGGFVPVENIQLPVAGGEPPARILPPKAGSAGFLGAEGDDSTATILLLAIAAVSVAVAGRMVTRRR